MTIPDTSLDQISFSDAEDDGSAGQNRDINPIFSARKRSSRHSELDFAAVPGEILHQYRVTRHDFGPNIAARGDELVTDIGAFYSVKEANLQAQEETRRKRTGRVKDKRSRKGWSEEEMLGERELGSEINVVTDGVGCRSWRVMDTVGEGFAVKVVRGWCFSLDLLK